MQCVEAMSPLLRATIIAMVTKPWQPVSCVLSCKNIPSLKKAVKQPNVSPNEPGADNQTTMMSTRRNNHKTRNTSRRSKTPPRDRAVLATNAKTGRVLVIETLHAAEDIIRVSIETVTSRRLPERIIMGFQEQWALNLRIADVQ